MKVGGCGPAQPGAFADPLGCCEGNELCILLLLLGVWRSVDPMKVEDAVLLNLERRLIRLGCCEGNELCVLLLLLSGDLLIR